MKETNKRGWGKPKWPPVLYPNGNGARGVSSVYLLAKSKIQEFDMPSGLARAMARRVRGTDASGAILTNDALFTVATGIGVRLLEYPFEGEILGVLIGAYVGLRVGIGDEWRRWALAILIGHRMVRRAERVALTYERLHSLDERGIVEFAGWLLLGDEGFERAMASVGPFATATEATLPVECFSRWCAYVSDHGPSWRATG